MPVAWSTWITTTFELSAAWNSEAKVWTEYSVVLHGVSISAAMLRWSSNRWMNSSSSTHTPTSYTCVRVADKIQHKCLFLTICKVFCLIWGTRKWEHRKNYVCKIKSYIKRGRNFMCKYGNKIYHNLFMMRVADSLFIDWTILRSSLHFHARINYSILEHSRYGKCRHFNWTIFFVVIFHKSLESREWSSIRIRWKYYEVKYFCDWDKCSSDLFYLNCISK